MGVKRCDPLRPRERRLGSRSGNALRRVPDLHCLYNGIFVQCNTVRCNLRCNAAWQTRRGCVFRPRNLIKILKPGLFACRQGTCRRPCRPDRSWPRPSIAFPSESRNVHAHLRAWSHCRRICGAIHSPDFRSRFARIKTTRSDYRQKTRRRRGAQRFPILRSPFATPNAKARNRVQPN
jgi:hypothetical protein